MKRIKACIETQRILITPTANPIGTNPANNAHATCLKPMMTMCHNLNYSNINTTNATKRSSGGGTLQGQRVGSDIAMRQ
jgi:hypothetical protein